MDPTAEKKIVEKYFLKSRQDRALYALRSAKRHAYIWNLNESFSGMPIAKECFPMAIKAIFA